MGEIDDEKQFTKDKNGRLYDAYGNEMGNSTISKGSEPIWWKAPLAEKAEKEAKKEAKRKAKEKQKEINAIGKPGERTIDDLLAAFQKGNNDFMKNSEIDRLDDEAWTSEMINHASKLGKLS